MRVIQERAKAGAAKIQNFDSQGNKFLFLSQLNSYTVDGVPFLQAIQEASAKGDMKLMDDIINKAIDDVITEDLKQWKREDTTMVDENGNTISLKEVAREDIISGLIKKGLSREIAREEAKKQMDDEAVDSLIEEYFWNQMYATSQIIQITVTDPAYYKPNSKDNLGDVSIDFQKRFKQVYAAGTKLNTNSKYGKTHELTIYLADNIQTSGSFNQLKTNLQNAIKEKRMTQAEADFILETMMDINATDAQAYRNLDSMRSLLDMMGRWDEKMEATLQRFSEGTYTKEDFDCVWQTIKPFVFTQIAKPDGLGGWMRVPHQNKNSEFLILAMYNLLSKSQRPSAKQMALDRFMHDNGIDVAQFESAVKSGGQGIIDISVSPKKVSQALTDGRFELRNGKVFDVQGATAFYGKNGIKEQLDEQLNSGKITQGDYNQAMDYFEPSQKEVYEMLTAATKQGKWIQQDENAPDFGFNQEVVHAVPYESFIVQQPTPEHLFDAHAVFGSQFRNLVTADMPANIEITVNGHKIKGRDNVLKTFQNAIIENLLEDYQKVINRFATIEDLQKAILETVQGNPKYGREFLEAMEIVEVEHFGSKIKTFNLPMNTPTITVKLQELVNAMFKNAVTKQSIKGGNAILVSDFGFSKELRVVRDKKTGALQEVECYLPWYSKKNFEGFLDTTVDAQGRKQEYLNIEKLEKQAPELLKLIGYRIPTEGKYSMLPLKIKGFLPQQNGSAIMLPADITAIAGSDFDKHQC
jgi:hypothetical protein